MPDGSMVAVVQKGKSSALVILAHDCRLRATFSAEQISSVGASDTGTVIALVRGDGFGDIVEISLDGAVLARRRVKGSLDDVLGRRRGIDYVIQSRPRTDVVRVHDREPARRVFSVTGVAWFGLAADGETLAWMSPRATARHTDSCGCRTCRTCRDVAVACSTTL